MLKHATSLFLISILIIVGYGNALAGIFDGFFDLFSKSYEVVNVKGKILFDSDRVDDWGIYTLNDRNLNLIVRGGANGRFSADGSKIICKMYKGKNEGGISVIDADGSNSRVIQHYDNRLKCDPLFSPDSMKIYFVESNGEDSLCEFDVQSNTISRIMHRKWLRYPDLSPDGRFIVLSSDRYPMDDKSYSSIWIIDLDNSEIRKLTDNPGDIQPAWSPDGKYIAFSSQREGDRYKQIYIMYKNGGILRKITTSKFNKKNPCWSPDGTMICYEAYTHGSIFGQSELFVINIDGTGEAKLLEPVKVNKWDWSTDRNPHWVE